MEKTETTTIEHDQWGNETGMVLGCGGEYKMWEKRVDGRLIRCFSSEGWREVKSIKWVRYALQTLKDNKEEWRNLSVWFQEDTHTTRFELPKGYRWKTVEIEREVEGCSKRVR